MGGISAEQLVRPQPAITIKREAASFDSRGVTCRGWIYRPSDNAGEPLPCVVLGHGLSGTREMGLDRLGTLFASRGIASLAFDYRHFGSSDGTPRQLLEIKRQLQDYAAAVRHARSLDWVDSDRIGLWGTALSSGHAFVTASRDPKIAAVAVQLPYLTTPHTTGPIESVLIGWLGIRDAIGAMLGRPPKMLKVIGPRQRRVRTLITDPDLVRGLEAVVPPDSNWRNEIAARFVLRAAFYRPGRHVASIRCPLLLCVAERDRICTPERAMQVASSCVSAEVSSYPIGHFEIGLDQNLEMIGADQGDFFARTLLEVGS